MYWNTLHVHMSKEREVEQQKPTLLTGIHLDLPTRTITLSSAEQVVVTFRLAPEGLVFTSTDMPSSLPPAKAPAPPDSSLAEKDKPQTLQGRLKSKPKQGRPDRNDKPTAWARFAAH